MTQSAETIARRELLGRGAGVAALTLVGGAVPLTARADAHDEALRVLWRQRTETWVAANAFQKKFDEAQFDINVRHQPFTGGSARTWSSNSKACSLESGRCSIMQSIYLPSASKTPRRSLPNLMHRRLGANEVLNGEQVLIPTLKPGDVVIMDNLGSHKGKAVRQALRAAGAKLLFLPPLTAPISAPSSKSSPSSRPCSAKPPREPSKPPGNESVNSSTSSPPPNAPTTSQMQNTLQGEGITL